MAHCLDQVVHDGLSHQARVVIGHPGIGGDFFSVRVSQAAPPDGEARVTSRLIPKIETDAFELKHSGHAISGSVSGFAKFVKLDGQKVPGLTIYDVFGRTFTEKGVGYTLLVTITSTLVTVQLTAVQDFLEARTFDKEVAPKLIFHPTVKSNGGDCVLSADDHTYITVSK